MNKKSKYAINIAIILLVPIVTLTVLLNNNFKEIAHSLRNLNYFWLFLALILILLWQFLVGMALTKLTKFFHKSYKYHQGFFNAIIAGFFHGITPSASGGQFIQTYVFKKQGVSSSESICVLWLDFIIYQVTMCMMTLVLIVVKFDYFKNTYSKWFGIILLGFIFDASIIFGLYALARFKKLHLWISNNGIGFLHKIHLIKDQEKTKANLELKIERFQTESKKIVGNTRLIIITIIINALRLLVYYSIPFVVFVALGLKVDFDLYITSITISSFISMLSNYIPLPGGSGGAESLFVLMFGHLFLSAYVQIGMLIWRFLTYYVVMIIGAICFMYLKIKEDL